MSVIVMTEKTIAKIALLMKVLGLLSSLRSLTRSMLTATMLTWIAMKMYGF
jgi:hypothetical protein